jgi:hypothetical protein
VHGSGYPCILTCTGIRREVSTPFSQGFNLSAMDVCGQRWTKQSGGIWTSKQFTPGCGKASPPLAFHPLSIFIHQQPVWSRAKVPSGKEFQLSSALLRRKGFVQSGRDKLIASPVEHGTGRARVCSSLEMYQPLLAGAVQALSPRLAYELYRVMRNVSRSALLPSFFPRSPHRVADARRSSQRSSSRPPLERLEGCRLSPSPYRTGGSPLRCSFVRAMARTAAFIARRLI